jgi:hypothetical protein
MKQLFLVLTLLLTVSISVPAYADETETNTETNEHYSRLFVVPDILIYRPVGFAFTVAGAALFVAMSPLTAFANIAPPHDAFEKMKDILIMAPANYTFLRPVGNNSVTDY